MRLPLNVQPTTWRTVGLVLRGGAGVGPLRLARCVLGQLDLDDVRPSCAARQRRRR